MRNCRSSLLVSAFRRYQEVNPVQRIGVFVCHCGSNIAATVDVKRVAEMARRSRVLFMQKTISICVPKPDRP